MRLWMEFFFMYLIMGVAAMVASVLLYGWALGLTRMPSAPSWAKSQLFSSTVCLVIVGLAPLSAGLLAVGLTDPMTTLSMAGLVALAVSVPALWLVFPRLAHRGGSAAAEVVPMPVPPSSPTPVRPTKLAA